MAKKLTIRKEARLKLGMHQRFCIQAENAAPNLRTTEIPHKKCKPKKPKEIHFWMLKLLDSIAPKFAKDSYKNLLG